MPLDRLTLIGHDARHLALIAEALDAEDVAVMYRPERGLCVVRVGVDGLQVIADRGAQVGDLLRRTATVLWADKLAARADPADQPLIDKARELLVDPLDLRRAWEQPGWRRSLAGLRVISFAPDPVREQRWPVAAVVWDDERALWGVDDDAFKRLAAWGWLTDADAARWTAHTAKVLSELVGAHPRGASSSPVPARLAHLDSDIPWRASSSGPYRLGHRSQAALDATHTLEHWLEHLLAGSVRLPGS